MLLLDVVGRADKVPPEQIEATAGKVGSRFETIDTVVFTKHPLSSV